MSIPVEKYHRPDVIRDTYETPPELFARYHREFAFTLDVCALPDTAKCARYFTPAEDGLAQDWSGDVCWMNPPYGRAIAAWMRKAWEEARRGATVVCLVPSRTDAGWWHDYAEKAAERRFLRGRVKFVGMKHNAPFPCAVVIFRPPQAQEARAA